MRTTTKSLSAVLNRAVLLAAVLVGASVAAVVAGCSIGAVVGGCYAAGRLDRLEAFARSLTRGRVVRLVDPRLPGSGLIAGNRLRRRLDRHLGDVGVEALPVPPPGDDGRRGDRGGIPPGDGPLDLDCHPAAPGRGVIRCGRMREPYRLRRAAGRAGADPAPEGPLSTSLSA